MHVEIMKKPKKKKREKIDTNVDSSPEKEIMMSRPKRKT